MKTVKVFQSLDWLAECPKCGEINIIGSDSDFENGDEWECEDCGGSFLITSDKVDDVGDDFDIDDNDPEAA